MCLSQLQIICKNQSFSLHFLFKDQNLLKIRCSVTAHFYLKKVIENPDLRDVTFCIRIHGQSQDTLSQSIIKSTSATLFCSRVLRALLSGLSFIICPCGMPCCPGAPEHTHTQRTEMISVWKIQCFFSSPSKLQLFIFKN